MSKYMFDIPDSQIQEVNEILESLGLDIEIAFNIFVKRIIMERGLPFSLKQQKNMENVTNTSPSISGFDLRSSKSGRANKTITTAMIEEVWSAFTIYMLGTQNIYELKEMISEKTGMNAGSAQIYLNILIGLKNGEVNKRSMKTSDFEFFLTKFKSERSAQDFKQAIKSIKISIPYWRNNIPTFAANMEHLLAGFEK